MKNENDLISLCMTLLEGRATLTPLEEALVNKDLGTSHNIKHLKEIKKSILQGLDPLGEAFAAIRSASERRSAGAVYTPPHIVGSMMRWLGRETQPSRIIDVGAGSGRFIISAARMFPNASLIAVEKDPLAALMLRTNLLVCGYSDRTTILVDDYREINLSPIDGVTAFIGNPPYVRHHEIDASWKKWYSEHFKVFGIKASKLAGLHLHFFLKTRLLAQQSDVGIFITSAEWMDVNYGAALRNLLINELGGLALHVLEPTVEAFPGTATTAAITCFRVGENNQPLRVRSVDTLPLLNGLNAGTDVPREHFRTENKWSIIIRPTDNRHNIDEEMELGELFRVHRGQVTGANNVWVTEKDKSDLPDRVLIPTVTRANDLFFAGQILANSDDLRRVIDIPIDLDDFTESEQRRINKYLDFARFMGADQTYVAQHRKSWFSVGLKSPATILCTYMARRPPQFTLNTCGARHINIAHGLYPVQALDPMVLERIVVWLNQNITTSRGRTYSGGLTKFEPKEIERLRIPHLEAFAV